MGLGSVEVVRARRHDVWTREWISREAQKRGVAVAMIYTSWLEDKLPETWVAVGTWQIQDNLICGDDTVTFYAPTPDRVPELAANLRDFSEQLPPTVIQSGLYTEADTP